MPWQKDWANSISIPCTWEDTESWPCERVKTPKTIWLKCEWDIKTTSASTVERCRLEMEKTRPPLTHFFLSKQAFPVTGGNDRITVGGFCRCLQFFADWSRQSLISQACPFLHSIHTFSAYLHMTFHQPAHPSSQRLDVSPNFWAQQRCKSSNGENPLWHHSLFLLPLTPACFLSSSIFNNNNRPELSPALGPWEPGLQSILFNLQPAAGEGAPMTPRSPQLHPP